MDKKEFATFTAAIKTYYPKENILPNVQAVELWFRQLEDIPYEVAEAALNRWVATNKWSPSIAEIRETASSITQGDVLGWGEAWEKVMKAIRKYGYYHVAETLGELDDITRQAVKNIGGVRAICMSENITADRANFRTNYEALAQRKQKQDVLPPSVVAQIAKIQESRVMIEGGNNGRT